jgi:hypothetical protein
MNNKGVDAAVAGEQMANGHVPTSSGTNGTEWLGVEVGVQKGWWRTWMGEQIPIVLNLLLMVWWQRGFSPATSWQRLVDTWAGAAITLLGWQTMSIASRQQETNNAVGIVDHRIECWRTAERLSTALQVLNLFRGVAFAPTPFHLVHALFVAAYKPYRKRYVARRGSMIVTSNDLVEQATHDSDARQQRERPIWTGTCVSVPVRMLAGGRMETFEEGEWIAAPHHAWHFIATKAALELAEKQKSEVEEGAVDLAP